MTRFFVHKSIQAFAEAIVKQHGLPSEQALLFPSHAVAYGCLQFFRAHQPFSNKDSYLRIVDLYPNDEDKSIISAILFPSSHAIIAKAYWQHSGGGISSRRAEYCHNAFEDGRLAARMHRDEAGNILKATNVLCKGPRRYRKRHSTDLSPASSEQPPETCSLVGTDYHQFVEERFGRNLDISMADKAKLAIRRRIAGALTANVDLLEAMQHTHSPTRTAHVEGFSEDDVYLYPCGMNSIFNAHRMMMVCRGEMKSISYGSVTFF